VRVLVAPDSFKGTFTAVEVADAIAGGLERAGVEADRCPVADGGEGTLDALLVALGGRVERVEVRGPLGAPVEACFALLGDPQPGTLRPQRTPPTGPRRAPLGGPQRAPLSGPQRAPLGGPQRALLEMASASGLALVPQLDPWHASTYGTGQLIRAAVEAGAREVLVGVGGSATVDGGRGALEAIADAGGMEGARIIVLCDVRTEWERCAEIYGPQKGADAAMVARLAARLDAFASELERDPRGVPMTGAAGGLSGGLWGGLDAELQPGAPYVLDALGFDARLREADAVIVGEGRIDAQSAMGKIVGEIAVRARAAGVPVHALVGRNELAADIGLASVTEATTLAELEAAGERLASVPA
jgi:glycerate kinase